MDEDRFFTTLAEMSDASPDQSAEAPARLKARLYSAMVQQMAAEGPLQSLRTTRAAGQQLCVFERLLCVVPDDRFASTNPCRVCHARILAERFESPPVYWPNCPYVEFRRK